VVAAEQREHGHDAAECGARSREAADEPEARRRNGGGWRREN